MKVVQATLALAVSVALVAATGTGCSRSPESPLATPSAVGSPPGGGRLVPSHWDRGMNFVGFQRNAFSAGAKNGSVRAARHQLGLRTAVIVPHWFTRHAGSSRIFRTWKTPSDRGVVALARFAKRKLGMKTIIKPHVNSLDGAWRGQMKFSNRTQFWQDYTRIMLRYADLARKTRSDGLVVGTELRVVRRDQPSHWRGLISRLRNRFGGALYYAANYDALEDVAGPPDWFALLDGIGVDYYPDNSDMRPGELWRGIIQLRRRFGTRVVISEAGGSNRGNQALRFREVNNAMMNGAGHRWFRGIWWYDRFTLARGGYGKTWDEFTPDRTTSKWLCRTQTVRSDRSCDRLISRNW